MVIRRPMGWTAQTASRGIVAVLCCVVLVAAACSSDEGLKTGDAASLAPDSVAEVAVGGGEWKSYVSGDVIAEDAQVRATTQEARLVFRGGQARLAPGATATVQADTVTLQRGEVLVDSESGLAVLRGDTRVAVTGAVRVSSGLASRVAVYRGAAAVERPAQARAVTALRQLDLVPFRLSAQGDPLRYREGDPWDREFLADAIAFDGEAARVARGIDVEFGTAPRRPSFYVGFTQRQALPLLRRTAPVSKGNRFGPASDVLLTAFVADAAGPAGSLREGIKSVSQLRQEGARWGLIALELDVRSDAVVAAIDMLGTDQLALADRTAGGAAGAEAGSQAGVGDGASGPDAPGTGGSGEDGGQTSTPSPGGGGPTPPDSGGGDGDGDGDGGGGNDPAPIPPPEDTEDTVEEVVAEVIDNIPDDDDEDDDDGDGGGLPELPGSPPLPKVDLPLIR